MSCITFCGLAFVLGVVVTGFITFIVLNWS